MALAEVDEPPRAPFRVALSGSAVFAAAAVLLWTAGSPRERVERTVAHLLRRAALIAFVGYVAIASGPGAIVVLAVPFYWLSVPIVVASTLIWIAIRGWTALAGRNGS